jgi:hypothetical protein
MTDTLWVMFYTRHYSEIITALNDVMYITAVKQVILTEVSVTDNCIEVPLDISSIASNLRRFRSLPSRRPQDSVYGA